jgi:hypothetical protein
MSEDAVRIDTSEHTLTIRSDDGYILIDFGIELREFAMTIADATELAMAIRTIIDGSAEGEKPS